MGKRIKQREAQKHAEELALRQLLRTRTDVRPGFVGSFAEFAPHYRAKIERYRRYALRVPEDWTSRVRARSPELRFLDLVKFVFAQYPVARHLELAWTEETEETNKQDLECQALEQEGATFEQGRPDRCLWYIFAAQGKSLHREGLQHPLSKREVHHFLGAPPEIVSTKRAFWYAVAMAENEDAEVAERISRTTLADHPVIQKFWKDAARFFARHPLPVLEMNDLIDYFQAARDLDPDFEVHGRSLAALHRRMEDWHRLLQVMRLSRNDKWAGRPIPDAAYRTQMEDGPAVWRLRQITNAIELYREGERMQHCVMSYKDKCLESESSIWSMTCEDATGNRSRGLTIEVNDRGVIVQCRGFANRAPLEDEHTIVSRWALDCGLSV